MLSKPNVAAFDFDGTLTYRDSLLSFLYFAKTPARATASLLLCTPFLIGFICGLSSRQQTKEAILRRFFRGWPIERLRTLGKEFADRHLEAKLRPQAMQKLHWHLERGDRCVLVSASLDFYLKPWAERIGIKEILTSTLEVSQEGLVTGRLSGPNCWGPEKARRLKALLGESPRDYVLYAYGNSRGDREMLAMADYPSFI